MRNGRWVPVAAAIAMLATITAGCADEPDGARQAGTKDGSAPTDTSGTPSPEPTKDSPHGIVLLLRDPSWDADQISFHDPGSGTPSDMFWVRPPAEIEKYLVAPDGRLVGMEAGPSSVLHFFEPDPKNGQYAHTGSVEAEGSYSEGAPWFQDIMLGPDGDRIYVQAYAEGVRSAVFSTSFGGDSLERETTLPKLPDDEATDDGSGTDDSVWPQEWAPWRAMPDGSVGTIGEKNRTVTGDGRWIYQTWASKNDEIFAAAALEPEPNGGPRLNGYFSIARTGENEFIGLYDSELAYPYGDELIARMTVDPGNGEIEVDPLLGQPAGGEIGNTGVTVAPDAERAAVWVSTADRVGSVYVANLADPSREPKELEIGEAPATAVLGWI